VEEEVEEEKEEKVVVDWRTGSEGVHCFCFEAYL